MLYKNVPLQRCVAAMFMIAFHGLGEITVHPGVHIDNLIQLNHLKTVSEPKKCLCSLLLAIININKLPDPLRNSIPVTALSSATYQLLLPGSQFLAWSTLHL